MILAYRGRHPLLGARVYVAPNAAVVGDVVAGDDCSFWFSVTVRGDVNSIRVGPGTNVQDGASLHVTTDLHPLRIGAGVSIGHGAVVHGCVVEDGCLIGIGARILDGAVVEAGCIVGAGAVVTPGARIPSGHLATGLPARPSRPVNDGERDLIRRIAQRYVALKDEYLAGEGDEGPGGMREHTIPDPGP